MRQNAKFLGTGVVVPRLPHAGRLSCWLSPAWVSRHEVSNDQCACRGYDRRGGGRRFLTRSSRSGPWFTQFRSLSIWARSEPGKGRGPFVTACTHIDAAPVGSGAKARGCYPQRSAPMNRQRLRYADDSARRSNASGGASLACISAAMREASLASSAGSSSGACWPGSSRRSNSLVASSSSTPGP